MLDTGMVTHLNHKDHNSFMKLLRSVITKNSIDCSEAIKSMSTSIDLK